MPETASRAAPCPPRPRRDGAALRARHFSPYHAASARIDNTPLWPVNDPVPSPARSTLLAPAPAPIGPATVLALGPGAARVTCRPVGPRPVSAEGEPLVATLAVLPGYCPAPGDRVLVASSDDGAWVIAVLEATSSAAPALALADGSRASVEDGGLALRDAAGQLLLRYAEGHLHLAAPEGDLRLSARGDIVLEGGADVRVHGPRAVSLGAGPASAPSTQVTLQPRSLQVETERVGLRARIADVAAGSVSLVAAVLTTTAERITSNAEHHAVDARHWLTRAEDALHVVRDLVETRAGRARTLVEGTLDVHSRRTNMVSEAETSIDGERVLLG